MKVWSAVTEQQKSCNFEQCNIQNNLVTSAVVIAQSLIQKGLICVCVALQKEVSMMLILCNSHNIDVKAELLIHIELQTLLSSCFYLMSLIIIQFCYHSQIADSTASVMNWIW